MSLPVALLLSLVLHAILILAPTLQGPERRSPPAMQIEARLIPQTQAMDLAEAVTTAPLPNDPAISPPTPSEAATTLRGSALRRARAALSKHLYYPPQAVAMGLEGDVILLLVLSERGQVLSAAVARGSGHDLLDQAALDAARHIGALPGNPRQTLFPVSFRLE